MRGFAYVLAALATGGMLVIVQNLARGAVVPLAFVLLVVSIFGQKEWAPRGFFLQLLSGIMGLWLLGQPKSTFDQALLHRARWVETGLAGLFILGTLMSAITLPKAGKAARRAYPWLFGALTFALLVAFFSGSAGGGGSMKEWLIQQFHLSPEAADGLTYAFRKTVHFTFYALVATFMGRAALRGGEPTKSAVALGLAFTLLLAGFDELRQAGFSDRTGSPFDVLLDLAGGTTGLAITFKRSPKKRKPANSP